jgi:D-alanine-D-alanine ligase
MATGARPRVLVLGGGPDAERSVSLKSAAGVAAALESADAFDVELMEIEILSASQVAALEADVIFPVLHGPWGEGGALQRLLEADGRTFVGSGSAAASWAMDKIATKQTAAALGLRCTPTRVLRPGDDALPLELPVVAKPVFEGSTVGLSMCRTREAFAAAHAEAVASGRPTMVEPLIAGREITVGAVDGRVLGEGDGLRVLEVVEIAPAEGHYDFAAKYERGDTRYAVGPTLPACVRERVREQTLELGRVLGVRHLCRADFIVDDAGEVWFLELNTMPGFTAQSLLPMAAVHDGVEMASLCAALVRCALEDVGVGARVP